MSATCPNGHQSETSDYCDQCGARIEGAAAQTDPEGKQPAPAMSPVAVPGSSSTEAASVSGALPLAPPPSANDEPCPLCHTPRVGSDRYCEGCGYDFTAPSPGPQQGPLAAVLAAASDTNSQPAWEAVAMADREYYDRVAPDDVTFPQHCPPRTYLLAGDQIRIGRRSSSRGIQPEVDLSGAPEDSAISHLHCLLLEQSDGTYSLIDPGSTNGTTLNDDPTPLMANAAVSLADGDRIHLGAWTTITVRALPLAPAVP